MTFCRVGEWLNFDYNKNNKKIIIVPIDINFIKGLSLNSQHIRLLYERADIWSALSDQKW